MMTDKGHNGEMKIANWNIEWMNDLFLTSEDERACIRVQVDHEEPDRCLTEVDALCRKIAGVIRAMDPDILVVEEGPSRLEEMALFIATYLDGGYTPLAWPRCDDQNLAHRIVILVKEAGPFRQPRLVTEARLILETPWHPQGGGEQRFTRLPVVVEGMVGGAPLLVIGVHVKANYIPHGEELWQDPERREAFLRELHGNRLRMAAEALRLRGFIDALLARDPGVRFVVAGDFNEGPGCDRLEHEEAELNVVDLVQGVRGPRPLLHPLLAGVPPEERHTVVYHDYVAGLAQRRSLVDHILLSPSLASWLREARVEHGAMAAVGAVSQAVPRLLRVSDHAPVSVVLEHEQRLKTLMEKNY